MGLLTVALRFYRDASVRELLPVFSDFHFFWGKIGRLGKFLRV